MSRSRGGTSATKERILEKLHAQMAEIEKLDVCLRIQKARVEAGFTQEQAADLFGISTRAYQAWEANVIPWRRLHEVAEAYRVERVWLQKGERGEEETTSVVAELRALRQELAEIRSLLRRPGEGREDPPE